MTKPLLAIDGDNVVHRSFHALPASIKDGEGRTANAIVGFGNQLLRLWDETSPRTMFVAFDTPTEPTYRHELLAEYQSGRDFTQDRQFMAQLDRAPELVAALGLPWAKQVGYEADDFLAAAARAEEAAGGSAVVFSSDRDLFQLASERTTILQPKRAGVLDQIGPAEVRERYGVEPRQVPDFIALRGDASDRIPGASGVGPAKAAAVLRELGSLEAALTAGRFGAEADGLRRYLSIARLRDNAPIPPLPDCDPDWVAGADLTAAWGLRALSERLRAREE
jgi:DNA polymerase I